MSESNSSSNEIWKDIAGYENKYQISTFGRFRNKLKIMQPMVTTSGYLSACLWKDNKQRKYSIHRLVAEAFIDNPNNYPEINHIDEDKTNNRVDNLEWCLHKYNMNYGDVKTKISQSNSGKKASLDTKIKLSQNSKNRFWVNNGKVEKFIKKEDKNKYCQWNIGRLKRR